MATAEGSARSPSDDCSLCAGTGTLSWQQPQGPNTLRTIEMPCPNGCSGHWKHPHAERDRVVTEPDDAPSRVKGNADEANSIGAEFIRGALEKWGFLDDERDGGR
ncbi:hypothetical protein B0I33_102457 [Prauserella shujinwangii]|uniref:Uncharacterized protein n=1 Tax=Prauserella shujinwangii TaxID=1453103 RepID=A0A2T0M150_9PSEU|nr:hypothetical protein [Prauserella shujinwangii]PRX50336.1 hypothetical protein B0I33_102457 [Prauserella shujinwangii]